MTNKAKWKKKNKKKNTSPPDVYKKESGQALFLSLPIECFLYKLLLSLRDT